jgi:ABC-type sugar transport system ATPase subunit
VAGLEHQDAGDVAIGGTVVNDLPPRARDIAMVFQNYALYPHMTVFDNIAFPLKVMHTPKNDMVKIVGETAALLELDKLLDRRPAQLSGGQRQRVALGRGLVRQPSIFLLDEPLSNLDAALRLKMRQEIVALQKRIGITMIYVTHDQVEALTMADRMVVLNDGRISQWGTPAEVYNNPGDSFVASFIGTPPINLFEDNIEKGVWNIPPLTIEMKIPDGKYLFGIRPEHLVPDEKGPLSGEIVSVEYIGAVSYVKIEVNKIPLTASVEGGGERYKIGQRLRLAVDDSKIYLFDPDTGKRCRI